MGLVEGKVAVVTGAGRGIGRGEAMLLAAEGAKVVVNDLGVELDGRGRDQKLAARVVDEIQARGGEAAANFENVADHQAAKRIIEFALERFGRLDILVNNAGFLRDKMIYHLEEEMWEAVIAVHLKGTFNLGKWACRYFREKGAGGRIINTTSAAGLFGNVGQSNYGAAKAGIANLTLTWAREMEKYRVTVNAIAPAARTRMTESAFGQLEVPAAGEFDSMHPDNVAPLVVYLASDAAGHLTGQVFGISGGDIDLYEPWQVKQSLSKEGRWTPAELVEKMRGWG